MRAAVRRSSVTDSCSGPGCAFRKTHLTAALVGVGVGRVAVGEPPASSLLTLGAFAVVAALMLVELWAYPVGLWWRWLAVGTAGAAVVGLVGGVLASRVLTGVPSFVALVGALVVAIRYVPRLVTAMPLAPAETIEPTV